jgi:hypothetical protein
MTRKANSRQETEGSNPREHKVLKGLVFFALFAPFVVKQQRRVLFDAQDDIDRRREQLIAEIEGKLQQSTSKEKLFTVRWRLG